MKSKMVKKNKTEKNTDFFCPAAVLKKSKKTVRETQRKVSVSLTISPLINFETSSQVL